MSRNLWAAVTATVIVAVAVLLGLRDLGGPGKQRMVQADLRVLRTMAQLAQSIQINWAYEGKTLPPNLINFPAAVRVNPISHEPFVYRPKSSTSGYELCATFLTDSRNLPVQNAGEGWSHPKGNYCFQLDAKQQIPEAPFFY